MEPACLDTKKFFRRQLKLYLFQQSYPRTLFRSCIVVVDLEVTLPSHYK